MNRDGPQPAQFDDALVCAKCSRTVDQSGNPAKRDCERPVNDALKSRRCGPSEASARCAL
jgi:hypothetical protein